MMSEWIQKNRSDGKSLGVSVSVSKKIIYQCLSRIQGVGLHWVDELGTSHFFGDKTAAIQGECRVYHAGFYRRLLRDGSIGAGEGYILGEWSSPDLTKALTVFAKQMPLLDDIERRTQWLTTLKHQWVRFKTRNRREQAQKNIMAHYDIGNTFYETFLDDDWLYSSALYRGNDITLEEAQRQKMKRLCTCLQLSSQDHVLEIGTGWGAMAIFMAQEYGCRVTTTTISPAQHQMAKERIEAAGLSDRITLLMKDYRDLSGQFDKVVSIEMIEAVGEPFLTSFVKVCQQRLKPQGRLAIQCITIADQRFSLYKNRLDFIQKHVFPGGFLPSLTCLLQHMTTHTDFILQDLKNIGSDYAKTLVDWRHRFESHYDDHRQQGLDDDFLRLWRFYFCYCEAGFLTKNISAVQLVFDRTTPVSE